MVSKNILCVVAHPDDEALGVGGTLIKHIKYGDQVYLTILSKGEAAKRNYGLEERERESGEGDTLRAPLGD